MLNSSNHSWRDIGSKKRQHTQDQQSSSSIYKKSQKFDPEANSKRSGSESKYFKLNAINHSQSMIIRESRLSNSKDSNSPVKPSRLATEVWQKDTFGVQSGLTILTREHFADQNQGRSRSVKRENKSNIVISQMKQQFKKFKDQVFNELRLMQQRMNQVINQVIGSYRKQVEKISLMALQKNKKMININIQKKMDQLSNLKGLQLINIEDLSPVKAKKSKVRETISLNSNQSYSPLLKDIKSNLQPRKKQNFSKFLSAIQRLKRDIQQMNQISQQPSDPKSPSFKISFASTKMK